MTRFVADASELPDHAFDTRSVTWWGVLGYIAIEGAGFVLLWSALLYVRGRVEPWPPSHVPDATRWAEAAVAANASSASDWRMSVGMRCMVSPGYRQCV